MLGSVRTFGRLTPGTRDVVLYAATKGALDDIPSNRVKDWESGFYRFLETERPKILTDLAASGALGDDLATAFDEAIKVYRESFLA